MSDSLAPHCTSDSLAPHCTSDSLAPHCTSDSLAPHSMSDSLAPHSMSDSLAPHCMSDSLAPHCTSDSLAPCIIHSYHDFRLHIRSILLKLRANQAIKMPPCIWSLKPYLPPVAPPVGSLTMMCVSGAPCLCCRVLRSTKPSLAHSLRIACDVTSTYTPVRSKLTAFEFRVRRNRRTQTEHPQNYAVLLGKAELPGDEHIPTRLSHMFLDDLSLGRFFEGARSPVHGRAYQVWSPEPSDT